MSLPYSLDSLLAKQNLFYDECNDVAQTIADELVEADRHNEEDLEEYITDQVRDHVGDMMTAYAEDLMNSYGITKAMREYIADCDEEFMNYDLEDDLFANSVVLVIMTKPVISRVKGILEEHRRSLQRSS